MNQNYYAGNISTLPAESLINFHVPKTELEIALHESLKETLEQLADATKENEEYYDELQERPELDDFKNYVGFFNSITSAFELAGNCWPAPRPEDEALISAISDSIGVCPD